MYIVGGSFLPVMTGNFLPVQTGQILPVRAGSYLPVPIPLFGFPPSLPLSKHEHGECIDWFY